MPGQVAPVDGCTCRICEEEREGPVRPLPHPKKSRPLIGCWCPACEHLRREYEKESQEPLTKEKLDAYFRNVIIADDPQSAPNPMTAEKREAVREWFDAISVEKGLIVPMAELEKKPEHGELVFYEKGEEVQRHGVGLLLGDAASPPSRLRRYFMSTTGLLGMITLQCPFEIVGDFPDDAQAISMSYNHEKGCFVVILSCEDFEEVELGAIIPEGGPIGIRALPRKIS